MIMRGPACETAVNSAKIGHGSSAEHERPSSLISASVHLNSRRGGDCASAEAAPTKAARTKKRARITLSLIVLNGFAGEAVTVRIVALPVTRRLPRGAGVNPRVTDQR